MSDGNQSLTQRLVDQLSSFLDSIGSVFDGLLGFAGSVGFVILIISIIFVLRILLLLCLRFFGLYNPNGYMYFPHVPWRFFAGPFRFVDHWIADFMMGKQQNAKWSGPLATLCRMYRPGMVFLGRIRVFNIGWFMPVGIKTKRHLVMIAATGAGKTSSVISMLSLHRGNCFVIDPKGQITTALYDRFGHGGNGIVGKGGTVALLDPQNLVDGIESSSWNPFSELRKVGIDEGQDAIPEIAAKMASALVEQDSETQPIFANAAREFVKALILHVYTTEPEENQTLSRVRALLTRGLEGEQGSPLSGIPKLLFEMEHNTSFEAIGNSIGTVRDALKRDNQGAFLSSANVQLGWIDFPLIQKISEHSDFSLTDLKESDLSLFIVAKPTDIRDTYKGWFRLLTVMSVEAFERNPRRPAEPTMFVIDEAPSLGNIEVFETSAALMRGYGVQLLIIAQDIEILSKAYPDSWGSMLGNADAVLWMGSNHAESLDYLQSDLGQRSSQNGGDRPIAYAEQLKRFLEPKRDNVVVTLNGSRALRLKTPHYFRELPVYHYRPDPNEGETKSRKLARYLCDGWPGEHIEPRGHGQVLRRWFMWAAAVLWPLIVVPILVQIVANPVLDLTSRWIIPGFFFLIGVNAILPYFWIRLGLLTAPVINRMAVLYVAWPFILLSIVGGVGMILWGIKGFNLFDEYPHDRILYGASMPFHVTYIVLAYVIGMIIGTFSAIPTSAEEAAEIHSESWHGMD